MSQPSRHRLVPLLAIALIIAPAAGAQEAGETVVQRGQVKEDLYLAGGTVNVEADVDGDVAAAGARVTIDQRVSGDVFAVGGSVDLRARVGDDARLAGGEVTIRGTIGDHLIATGGSVMLAPESDVGGRTWLSGGTLEINGRIGRELKAAGGTIIIAGDIGGDANLIAEHIDIRPGARIRGALNYRSPNPAVIAPDARVDGVIVQSPMEGRPARAGRFGGTLFALLSLFATAVVLYFLFPRFASAAAGELRAAPWRSLGLGIAVLAGGPLVVLLLVGSVLGLWLALIVLALYALLLLAGYLTGVLSAADAALQATRRGGTGRGGTLAAVAAVLVVLALLRWIPVLGGLISFALLLLGLGALTHALWRGYAAPTTAAAPRSRSKRAQRG